MKNQIIPKLIEIGLNDKEARLYLAALKMGAATAQQLSLESGIKRATVYLGIQSLIARGLLHVEIIGKRKSFIAESPDKLELLLEQKKQTLISLLPALVQSYAKSHAHSDIKIYQGLKRIKLLYDTLLNHLKAGDDYLVISDQEKWHAQDPIYFEHFMQKRGALNLALRLILQDTAHARKYKRKEHLYGEKIKFLPKHIEMNTNMVILPDKVIILQTVEPIHAIVIENQNVTAMNRALFNTIWDLIP